jgi:hypothetical protein
MFFVLILIILTILGNNIIGESNTYGMNKTVGWAYDIILGFLST